jgi:hypothetical protein
MIVRRTTRDELRRVAAETFGWSRLRDEQLQAMEMGGDLAGRGGVRVPLARAVGEGRGR